MEMTRALALLTCAALGCGGARTEVVLLVGTDLSTPGELDQIRIDVRAPGGSMQTAFAYFGEGEPAPPRSLGIASDGALGPFRVLARGTLRGALVVERSAQLDLQRDRTLVLRMDLDRSCISRTCGAGETCAAGECRSMAIDGSELEVYRDQFEPLDASIDGSL
jgi:hypothetical protein